MKDIFIQIDTRTYVLTGVILCVAVICWIYIEFQKRQGYLITKRRWIEQIPSFVSTLGVLGTFLGYNYRVIRFRFNESRSKHS